MANKNDVVIIELDRPRELRFGHKALKHLSAITGMSMESMMDGEIDFSEFEKIIYCGLLSDARANREQLQLDQMEDLLDLVAPNYYMAKMTEAFEASFGSFSEGNGLKPPGKPQTKKQATKK